jgi:hypothetical protein
VNRSSTLDQASSSLSSLNNSNSSNSTTFPIHSLVEGSLEYRELKRLYLDQKTQSDEWRKDYQVLKQQLALLKSNTIRECNILNFTHKKYKFISYILYVIIAATYE